MTVAKTLIIRQGPKRFIVVEQDERTSEAVVYPSRSARKAGVGGYTYRTAHGAAREGHAQKYRTIKAALSEHPEAQRAPEYDLEADG